MSPMDEDADIEPNDHALRQVIGVLTPLRQHRQARAERSRQRIEQNLETLREQLLNCQATWSQERDRQQVLRQQLSDTYLQQRLELKDIDRWHEQERRMLDRLAHIRQSVSQLRARIEEQEQQLQRALLELKTRQRAVEKLACMTDSLNGE